MNTLVTGPVHPLTLSAQETGMAQISSDALAQFVTQSENPIHLRLLDRLTGQAVEATIPALAVRVLAEALLQMSQGQSITLVPLQAELSTKQAADLMGVSRPYFTKLLEQKAIPFRKAGTQRRVQYRDLLAYMERYRQEATAALDEMAAEAQRLGLYE